ncbi:MAG: undecaprenyldiphospho-muramoylpentapeptide beta-N-acetylglucosaminyltransferase [Chloroflexota bacterium]
MRVIIAGGGTGGHLYPGLAVAEAFKEQEAAKDILFVGTEHGIEARVVPKEGYPIKFVKAEGVAGKNIARKVRALFVFVLSLKDSGAIVRTFRPDIVIGVGGYASAGAVCAAWWQKVPTMILEQNSVPGLANRILGKMADAVAVTYQESLPFFPDGKTFLTGNPVRKGIVRKETRSAHRIFSLVNERFTVLVFGGSAGARSINRAMAEALPYLQGLRGRIQFLHQTGERDHAEVAAAYRAQGFQGTVVPFIYQMAEAYAAADLVICRAGATTLAELTAVGKPSILVPYPYAAANHQEHNARKLEDMGAARMIRDRDLSGRVIASAIEELYNDENLRKEMQRASTAFGKVDAAERVVAVAMSLLARRRAGRGA